MIRRTGLAPWEFEFPFPGSLTSFFLGGGTLPSASTWEAHTLNPKIRISHLRTLKYMYLAMQVSTTSMATIEIMRRAQVCTLHPKPYTLHTKPDILHPTTHTLHLTPYNPSPYTLHPTPYTLHPTPNNPHPTP